MIDQIRLIGVNGDRVLTILCFAFEDMDLITILCCHYYVGQ